jgi:hypothetical protein
MPSCDEGDDRVVRVNATGLLSAAVGRASAAGPIGLGLLRTYARTVGVIQWLNAAFFGWMTYIYFAHGRFYNPALRIKGGHSQAYLDFGWLIFTPVFGLLSVSGFLSGWGLLKLRPWVRRWAAAYLGILLLGTAAATVVEMPRLWLVPESRTALLLFSTAFALPCLPLLFGAVFTGISIRDRRSDRSPEQELRAILESRDERVRGRWNEVC